MKNLLILAVLGAFAFAVVGCAPSNEGEVAKPDISQETKDRFDAKKVETGGASSGEAQTRSSPPPAPPSDN